MAKSDISVKLGLNSKEFDDNIKNSKKQIQQWKNQTQVVGKEMAKGFGVLAGAVLGAQGAAELFNKTINSTQATGDAFQKMLDQTTASSNLFFASIAQGDFSLFLNGLKSAISEAGKLSVILDNLATNKLFSTPQLAKLDRDIAGQTQIVKDRSKSEAERKAAAERIKALQAEKKAIKELTVSQSFDAGYQNFRVGMTGVGYTEKASNKDIDFMMELLRTGKAGDVGAKYNSLSVRSKELIPNTQIQTREAVAAEKELNKFIATEEGRISKMAFFANKATDAENSNLYKAVQDLTYSYNAQKQLIDEETSQIRAENMIGGSVAGTGKVSTPNTPIADYQFDAGLYINPTTEFERLQKQIDQHDSLNWKVELDDEEEAGDSFSFNNGNNPLENIVPKTTIEDYGNLAIAIAGVTTNLTNGSNAWVSYGANIISAVAAALPALNTLLAANTAVAGSGAAASVASIPFIGWAMAGVALAGVVASIATLPKFATGGVVGGGSYNGDKIPALLNAGEMVLNDRQQTNLFNSLNGSNGNNSQSGEVVFKIKGDYLEGILQKNNRKNQRV